MVYVSNFHKPFRKETMWAQAQGRAGTHQGISATCGCSLYPQCCSHSCHRALLSEQAQQQQISQGEGPSVSCEDPLRASMGGGHTHTQQGRGADR